MGAGISAAAVGFSAPPGIHLSRCTKMVQTESLNMARSEKDQILMALLIATTTFVVSIKLQMCVTMRALI